MPAPGYTQARKLGQAKAHEFSLVSNYKYGYRNREDVTNLEPGVFNSWESKCIYKCFKSC